MGYYNTEIEAAQISDYYMVRINKWGNYTKDFLNFPESYENYQNGFIPPVMIGGTHNKHIVELIEIYKYSNEK